MKGEGVDAGPAEEVVREHQRGGRRGSRLHRIRRDAGRRQGDHRGGARHFGRIDVLIHNAGNVRYGSLEEITHEDFEAVVDVHLMGAFHVVRPAFPLMCKAGYGRVVLTSSIGGLYGTENVVNYGVSKAGMIGLNNVIAIEGAAKGVKSNIILPGAVTRMAEGLDISQYPPMGPELVAPVVGWLAHECCSISGEMLISMAGRVAKAFIAETEGVYRPSWSIDDVANEIDGIRNTEKLWMLPTLPSGYFDHLTRSFEMANAKASKERGL